MIHVAWLGAAIPAKGGPLIHISHWAKNINKSRFKIILICSCSDEIKERVNSLEAYDIEVMFMPELDDLQRLYVPAIIKLTKLLNDRNILLLHNILTRSDVIGPIAAKLAKVPYVISSIEGKLISSYGIPSRWRRLAYHFGYAYSKNRIDKFIAISNQTKEDHCRDFNIKSDRIIVIHNGVEPQRFPWQKSLEVLSARLIKKEPVLGYFGVIGYSKGVDSLIEAALLVFERFPKAKLLIVGEGPDKALIQRRVQELDLESKVEFKTWVDDITKIMLDFDIFVLPSKAEGMPWAVLEAMACAKPVVATSVGGIPEVVVNGKTGILLSNSKPESIAQAVISLLANPEETINMGILGRKRIEEGFTVLHEMQKIEELYDSLTKSRDD